MDILESFIQHPTTDFHLRELARLHDASPATITKYAGRLVEEGLITRRRERNLLLFAANQDSDLFKRKASCYFQERLIQDGTIRIIADIIPTARAIIFHGSAARGTHTERSDIDLAVVTNVKTELVSVPEKLPFPLHIIQFAEEQLRRNVEMVDNLANGIVMHGYFRPSRFVEKGAQ